MSISGIGGSNLFAHIESAYGGVPTVTESAVINIPVRSGAIPSANYNRVSSRVVGDYIDRSSTYRVRSSVAGSFSFNPTSHVTNANDIHKMAGVGHNLTTDNYSSLNSYSMFLPMVEGGNTITTGRASKGIIFHGMMATQYTLSLPSDNALLDSSISFIGQKITDTNTGGTEENEWKEIITNDSNRTDVRKLGQPFETWTALISFGGATNWMSVNSMSINIANNLIPSNFTTSGLNTTKPTVADRNVTGTFTVPYSSGATGQTYQQLLALVESNTNQQKQIVIELTSSKDITKKITITMPKVVLMQGQSLNSITAGYSPMSFSFKAFGEIGTSNQEIVINNS